MHTPLVIPYLGANGFVNICFHEKTNALCLVLIQKLDDTRSKQNTSLTGAPKRTIFGRRRARVRKDYKMTTKRKTSVISPGCYVTGRIRNQAP